VFPESRVIAAATFPIVKPNTLLVVPNNDDCGSNTLHPHDLAMSFLSYLVKPLAYASLPVFILHTVSNASPLARYYVRLGLYLSALGICSAWGVVASIGMTIIGRRFDINWVIARSFYALAGSWLDIRFELEGEEHLSTRPAILMGNHQSMVDILYLGRYAFTPTIAM
jgi:lysophosphatidate acyltransferase